jgi:hypothetical protein
MIRTFLNFFKTTVTTQLRDYTVKKIRKQFHPLGRVPNVGSKDSVRVNTKINRYLYFQEKRLNRMKEKKLYDAIVLVMCLLLKNSLSYQITLFNRTCKG